MAQNRQIQRGSAKKKGKPKLRFNFGMLIVIFILSYAGCFGLYMLAANTNDDFFEEEFNNSSVVTEESAPEENSSPSDTSVVEPEATTAPPSASVTNPIQESAAVDVSYLDECCLITDSTLIGMKTNTSFTDVIGGNVLSAVSINSAKIESSYGTVTAYETMKIKKPMNIYIMLGSDLGTSEVDEMISNYSSFINNLKASVSSADIYVMQLPPVYSDTAVTNAMINEYNTKLLAMADNLGVYCIDTNTALKNVEGTLAEEYWSAETGSMTEKAYKDICGYILTHTV